MTQPAGPGVGPSPTPDAAQAAAARRAAALEAARQAQAAAAQATKAAAVAEQVAVRAMDLAATSEGSRLEAQAGPRGAVAMPTAGAPGDDFSDFEGFGPPAPAGGAAPTPAAAPVSAPTTQAALARVDSALAQLNGTPQQQTEAIAGLLGDPQAFATTMQQLAPLRDTPAFAAVKAKVDQIVAKATPQNLAAQLAAAPDLAALPPETLTNLARLRAVPDPALQGQLDKSVAALLPKLTPEQLKSNEALAVLVAPLGQSQDPAVKGALDRAVKGWTEQAMTRNLAGKKGEDGVKQGLDGFQNEIVALAEATGLGAQLQTAAQATMEARQPELEAKVKEGQGFFKRLMGGVSGLIDGVGSALGGALKFAVDGVGKVARFSLNVSAKISTVGLDLAAGALDLAGAKGAAEQVRKVDAMVEKAYDAVGEQVELFAEGVGSAFRDTITGVSTMIAHPIDTVKGIAHLVMNPSEIPKVAKALWDVATEKGAAYGVGYVAGNLLPMILSGGSSSGGTIGARLGTVVGNSRLASYAGEVAGLAKAGQYGKVVSGVAKAAGATASGYRAVATLGGRATTLITKPLNWAGKVASENAVIAKAAGYVKRAGAVIGETGPARAVKRLGRAYESKVAKLNDLVDGGLRRAVDGVENRIPTIRAEKLVAREAAAQAESLAAKAQALPKVPKQREGVGRVEHGPRQLTDADQELLAKHGKSATEVEAANRAGLGKTPNKQEDLRIKANTPEEQAALDAFAKTKEGSAITRNADLFDESPAVSKGKIGDGRVEDGALYQGARVGGGDMPSLKISYDHPKFKAALEEAKAIGRSALSDEEKIRRVLELVRKDGDKGLLEAASASTKNTKWFDEFNGAQRDQAFRVASLDDYFNAGVGDCRHFAATTQALLQEAIPGASPRLVYASTFENAANGTALAVNHAFNVVEVGGKQIVVDSILPHMTFGKVDDYVTQGIFGRQARFTQGRFSEIGSRWLDKAGNSVGTAFNLEFAPLVLAGQYQNAQDRR